MTEPEDHRTNAQQALEAAARTLSNAGQDPATRYDSASALALIGIGQALLAIIDKE